MNKKLLAVAVAGALAVPGLALAQSSVTISGIWKISVDNIRYGSAGAARAGSNSQWRTADDSSRIIFNVTEDLGGGLQAIGQVDWRVQIDAGGDAVSGNNWVGLRSKSWGTLTIGRHDLHYGKQPDEIAAKAGSLKLASVSLMDHTEDGTAIAGATRTTNVVRYDSPNWSGFAFTAAYSFNPTAVEADLFAGANTRKGRAINFNPSYTAARWQIGWSHWDQKADGAPAAAAAPATTGGAVAGLDQKSNSLYGYYTWGGFKIGAGWNKSRTRLDQANADAQNRTAWTIPARYTWGRHNVYGHYTRARDDKATANVDDGARMWSFAYVYDLSKRTSVGVGYSRIRNDTGAQYNFFTGEGALGAGPRIGAGEDPRLLAFTVRHAF